MTSRTVLAFIDKDKIADATRAAKELELMNWKLMLCFVGTFFYLIFLDTLKSILNLKEQKPVDEKSGTKHRDESGARQGSCRLVHAANG
jgi:hypothetical protein